MSNGFVCPVKNVCQRSSAAEQLFCKQQVVGSNPTAGLSKIFY